MLADLVDIDRIGPAQDVELLARDLAGATDRKARSGEGVATDEGGGQAQLAAQGADLVLEKLPQGLNQFQAHLFRQTTDVVVRFDGDRGTARKGDAFDHIGVKRALGKEFRALDLIGVFLEHINKEPPNGLALDLGVRDAFQRAEEQVFFIGVNEVQVVIVAEHGDDLFRLTQSQETMVDKDAGELIADGLVQKNAGDRAVNAA